MNKLVLLLLGLSLYACQQKLETYLNTWIPYDQSALLTANSEHPSVRMQFKLIQSKLTDKNEMLQAIAPQIIDFSETDYIELKPLILEKNIPTLQEHIASGKLSYKRLVQWYLYRIALYENDSATALNNVISINPLAVQEAEKLDGKKGQSKKHQIYGMPIFLKDNINTDGMATTAGAAVLQKNMAKDAFITKQLKENGAIILGKANLSEWANFLCLQCPNGYSAVGGQTLNPYGPREFDTGGSSAGSGSVVAANYAVAAIGTETSGSILSPASAQSVVGLKPTVGLLSRSGIVPISSTLDTPGPMTKSVIDNAILLSALIGYDADDKAMQGKQKAKDYLSTLREFDFQGKRFGVIKEFLQDSLYALNVDSIAGLGAEMVVVTLGEANLAGFLTLLNADMKRDLPSYFSQYGASNLNITSAADVIEFNKRDSAINMPYGQGRFYGVNQDTTSDFSLDSIRASLNQAGKDYFLKAMNEYDLDFIVSINNWSAGFAAVAKFPCITIPMGYDVNGEPKGITFIARPYQEAQLLQLAFQYEKELPMRKIPKLYE